MSAADIQRDLVAVLALLHPAHAEITELQLAGVTPERIATLYPPDYPAVTKNLRAVLATRAQLAKFLPPLVRGSAMQRLEMLEDHIPPELYNKMYDEDIIQVPERDPDAKALQALVDLEMRNQLWNLKPTEVISGALLNVASILWLAANWRQVPRLGEPDALAEIADLTSILRRALGAA